MKHCIVSLALLIVPLVALPISHGNAQSQTEMNGQAEKDFKKADEELNRTYAAVMAKLPDAESKRKLKKSQRAWIATRDAAAKSAADQVRGGSAAPVLRWTSMTETTEERIKQLNADFPDAGNASNKAPQPTSAAGETVLSSPMDLATSQIPKDYEMLEESASPDGRFAILSPVRNEKNDEDNGRPYPPNLLVRLNPYAVLAKVKTPGLPVGWRDKLLAEWNGNDVVAIWVYAKWGIANLSVYEIANDKLKRTHPVFREARKYFDRDFHQRFLKKYPKEYDQYTFVSHENEADFDFKGRRLLLNLYAENKPNVAPGPIWSAELHAIWNLDAGKFEKVTFPPSEIGIRKAED